MKKSGFLVLFAVLVLLLSACGNQEAAYENVSPEQAKELIDEKEVTVLDVRTIEEYNEGHIPNATLLPLQELEENLNELDKDKSYLIVCKSSNRSTQASEILVNNGFEHIYNMTGGMNEWSYDTEK